MPTGQIDYFTVTAHTDSALQSSGLADKEVVATCACIDSVIALCIGCMGSLCLAHRHRHSQIDKT